jgi:hypothetical protein
MRVILFVLFAASSPALLLAQRPSAGTLRVSAQIEGSMSVVFTAGSALAVRASGAGSATFTVPTIGGSFSMSAAPIAAGDTSFMISSPFEIQVTKANLLSASYTLRSWIQTPDPMHSWKIDGIEISKGRNQVISDHEPYTLPNSHALVVSGHVDALQNLTNAVTFQVIAN